MLRQIKWTQVNAPKHLVVKGCCDLGQIIEKIGGDLGWPLRHSRQRFVTLVVSEGFTTLATAKGSATLITSAISSFQISHLTSASQHSHGFLLKIYGQRQTYRVFTLQHSHDCWLEVSGKKEREIELLGFCVIGCHRQIKKNGKKDDFSLILPHGWSFKIKILVKCQICDSRSVALIT